MIILSGIRAVGSQRLRTRAENGDIITIDLQYSPATQRWYMNIESNDFVVNSICLVNSLNLLQQYYRIIPFGITILMTDTGDPFLINDFSTERARIGILTPAEVVQVNDFYTQVRGL